MKINYQDWLIYFAFFLLTLFFFFPFLTGSNVFAFRDLSLYFYPLRYLMVEMVKSGQLPLWNPYVYCGYPLFATLQIGFLYPFTIIHYFLPFNLAFNYYTILHYFLGAVFMYWLMRYFRLSRFSSFLSGVIFCFSGYLLSMANMNTTLTSLIWLPLLLLACDKMVMNRRLVNVLWLGIVIALTFLGGEPTVVYLGIFISLGYAVVIGFDKSKPWKVVWGVGGVAIALVLAIGLTAVQLLPLVEVISHSLRTTMIQFGFIAKRSFPPRELINLVFPFFFGNVTKGTYLDVLLGDQFQRWLISPYLGFFPLVFVFFSLKKINSRILFFWIGALFFLFLAFGRFTPFYSFFFHFLPGISLIRYPVKYLSGSIFFIAMLCGFGFEWFITEGITKSDQFRKILFWLTFTSFVLIIIFLIGNIYQSQIFSFFKSFYPQDLPSYFFSILREIISDNLLSLNRITILFLLGEVLFCLLYLRKISAKIFSCLIIILVLVDLYLANFGINPPGPIKIFSDLTPNLEILLRDRDLFRFYNNVEDLSPAGISFVEDLYHKKDNLVSNWLVPYKLHSFLGRESIEPRDFPHKKDLLLFREFLNIANVKYVFSDVRIKDFILLRKKIWAGKEFYLYRNPKVLPRAYVRDDVDSYKIQKRSEAKVIKYKENEIIIEAKLIKNGYLFLSDTYHPGWRAFVDGQETEICRTNHMFRAVPLNPGKHEVRFIYDPFSFKVGAVISGLTLLGMGVCLILTVKNKP